MTEEPNTSQIDGVEERRNAVASAGLRRLRRSSWLGLLLGPVALVVAVVLAASEKTATEHLDEVGRPVAGVVTEVNRTPRGGDVTVAYRYEGRDELLEVRLNQASPRYRVGQEVPVLIHPDDPSVRGLPGEDDSSILVIAGVALLFLVGFGGVGGGIVGLRRVRRLRRILRDHPWRTFPSRYVERPGMRSSVYQGLVLETAAGPRVLQFAGGWVWTTSRAGISDATQVEVAGPPVGRVAVRAPEGGQILSARDPRSRRARRAWVKHADVDPGVLDGSDQGAADHRP